MITFTALETAFFGGLCSLVVGMFIRIRSVSPHSCKETQRQLVGIMESLKVSQDIQFRMLRAVVQHLDLPAKDKAEILNMRPTRSFRDE